MSYGVVTNLSPPRVAVCGSTYADAWSHMHELNVKPSDGYVAVSLTGHPGSVSGMKFREVIYLHSWTEADTDQHPMAQAVARCVERAKPRGSQ